jgi:hypothetical protein
MSEYNHDQSVASAIWSISHNLNVSETVNDVLVNINGTTEKVMPLSIIHTDNNTLTISFVDPESGYARIIG